MVLGADQIPPEQKSANHCLRANCLHLSTKFYWNTGMLIHYVWPVADVMAHKAHNIYYLTL